MEHAKQYPFQAEVGVQLFSPLEQKINCKNRYGMRTCISEAKRERGKNRYG